jgi:hypothetical protein
MWSEPPREAISREIKHPFTTEIRAQQAMKFWSTDYIDGADSLDFGPIFKY